MRPLADVRDVPRSMLLSHRRTQADLVRRRASQPRSFPARMIDFLWVGIVKFVYHYLKSRFGAKYPFQAYTHSLDDNGVYPFQPDRRSAESIRMCLASDWGTGTAEAAAVAARMLAFDPHYTIHLGDIYYVGAPHEVIENCLTTVRWPHGSLGSFALNGNHEMYAQGKAYFTRFLPTLGLNGRAGQKASFFCLENDDWRIIGLDTAYNSLGIPFLEVIKSPDNRLPAPLIDWLREVVQLGNPADTRGLIFLSHHQYYSAFDDDLTVPASQLAELLQPNRPVLWFWGHEHRLAFYGKLARGTPLEAYGRCIGNGGMPDYLSDVPAKAQAYQLKVYDNRTYQDLVDIAIGYNGFTQLTFNGNTLTAEYRSLTRSLDGDTLLAHEVWRINRETGLLAEPEFHVDDPALTVVSPFT